MKKITNSFLIILTLVFTFLSLSCVQGSVETISSNTVQASQIYQIYTVETSKTKTETVAAFRIGGATGTTLELTSPAGILYNDQPMPVSAPSNLIGTNYKMKGTDYRTFSNNFQSTHEFSYTDADGKTYVNSITLAPVEISAKAAINLETENPSMIQLSRTIGANETLIFALDARPDEEIPTDGNTIYFNEKRNAIIITPQYWSAKQVRPQFDLQIKIKKSGGISNGTPLGGSISAVYKAVPVTINVEQTKKTSTIGDTNTKAVGNTNVKTKEKLSPVKSPEAEANVETQTSTNQNKAEKN
jgi:hypothetical protein